MATLPIETKDAIKWAVTQTWTDFGGNVHPITTEPSDAQPLVDKVCEYFANKKIVYGTFSYNDLIPIIEEIKAEEAAQPEEQPETPDPTFEDPEIHPIVG
jgi:hypothetical protein